MSSTLATEYIAGLKAALDRLPLPRFAAMVEAQSLNPWGAAMAADITHLIPTHRRPGYLRRALSYYGAAGAEVVVADSSPDAYPYPLGEGVRYLHFPGLGFMAKLAQVVDQIKTPYVVFCADDDFTVPRAVETCRSFLTANPDYASAQGDYYRAEARAGSVHIRRIYSQSAEVRVDSDSPVERLLQAYTPYIPTFYAVQRTQVLRDYVRIAGSGLENYGLLEICSAMVGAIHGKHKQLPLFYGVREVLPSEAPKDPRRRDGVEAVYREPRYAAEYALFLDNTAALLTSLHGLEPEAAKTAVQAAVGRYVTRYCVHTPRRTFIQKLPKYARRFADMLTGNRERKRQAQARQDSLALQAHFSAYDQNASNEREAILRLVAAGVA